MPRKAGGYEQFANELRRVAVMQEAMRDDITRIAEGHVGLAQRFDTVDQRFGAVERRIDDTQQALMEAVRGLKQQIGALQQTALELRAEIRTIGERLGAHLQQAHAT